MEETVSQRQQILSGIVDGLLSRDRKAANTAFCLAMDMCDSPAEDALGTICHDTETSHGRLVTEISLSLITQENRLSGFINAIRRWPAQEYVYDVGCGPFSIFAVAAALYHPRAEVKAVEINPRAAETAAKMVEIFGLSDRVEVINADIANVTIDPGTTAAVTETFNSALNQEPGPKIVKLLHDSKVPLITPSQADLCLSMPSGEFYQRIDLRRETHADVAYSGWKPDGPESLADINVCAQYHDDLGSILPYDADIITKGLRRDDLKVLRQAFDGAPESGRLLYELGTANIEPSIEVSS